MKISKAQFVREITATKTFFGTMTRNKATEDALKTAVTLFSTEESIKEMRLDNQLRKGEAHSNHILFTNGKGEESRLYFDQKGKYEFHRFDFKEPNGTAYEVHLHTTSETDYYMYYVAVQQ